MLRDAFSRAKSTFEGSGNVFIVAVTMETMSDVFDLKLRPLHFFPLCV